VTAGSAVAAGAGGFAGYQWHQYAMSRAAEVTQAALRGRDEAASALRRADDVLDGIVADATLGPAEKARKIGVVIESLRAQASRLLDSNHALQGKLDELERARANLEQSRDRAARERKSALDAKAQAEAERERALVEARAAETAKARADAERERALVEKLLAESAKARAEAEREHASRERRAAERSRVEAESERDRAVRERQAVEAAKARAENERDEARAERKVAEDAAFTRGLAAGTEPPAGPPPEPAR
jgi:chromosome segregation ATPase